VLAGVALAFAFGIQGLETAGRVLVGLVVFFGIAIALRVGATRRLVLAFSRWALPGAHG
jgi:hypothetical protein